MFVLIALIFIILNFFGLSCMTYFSCSNIKNSHPSLDDASNNRIISVDCNAYYGSQAPNYSGPYVCGTKNQYIINKADNSTQLFAKLLIPCVVSSWISDCRESFYQNFSDISSSPLNAIYYQELQFSCCNTGNCNNAQGLCISTKLFSDAVKLNESRINVNLTNLSVKDSCTSNTSSAILVSLNIGLIVSLKFKTTYANLSSQDSIDFINNFKQFISGAFSENTPIEIKVISLTSGSVVVNSVVKFQSNSVTSSSNFSSQAQSTLRNSANSSSSFPVQADSITANLSSGVSMIKITNLVYFVALIFIQFYIII